MKVILCGAGQVGLGIARHLSADEHDVTVIDSSEAILALQESLDVRTIVGAGGDPEVLEAAGAKNADVLIAVTRLDEMNMVICHIAQALFGISNTIAQGKRSQNYLFSPWREKLEESHILPRRLISPEREMAQVVLSHLSMPGALEVFNFAHGGIKLLGITLGEECPAVHTPLRQLTELFPNLRAVVTAVWREGELFIPRSDEQLQEGDEIYLVTDSRDAPRAMSIFGREEKEAHRILIVGGGQTGMHVAKQLEVWGRHMKVKIIEKDSDKATRAVNELSHTIVIKGDGLDPEILREAGARDTETLISLTNSDQTNLLISMLAKQEGCRKTICLLSEPVYVDIVEQVNIDAYLRLSSITISAILRNMRLGAVRTIHTVRDDLAQCMEIEAREQTDVVGVPLRELKLPARIGAVRRKGEFIAPSGDLEIQIGDRVILFVLREEIKEIESAFGIEDTD